MAQGNPVALKRTLESFKGVVEEVILGDLLLFDDDRAKIQSYAQDYNITLVPLPFNYLFKNGFSKTLNTLSSYAANDLVIYMNVGEIIDGEHRILELIEGFSSFNCYAFDHASDPHTWYRIYDRRELKWDGLLHEQLTGDLNPAKFYLFRMADTDKDNDDAFKAKCYDWCKECVYFKQYIYIATEPLLLGATDPGWVQFAKDGLASFSERLAAKGDFYRAFEMDDFDMLRKYISQDDNFKKEKMESSLAIEYQTDRKYLL